MFLETWREYLQEISQNVCMSIGVDVVDVVIFFYGDGPAAQFEAISKGDILLRGLWSRQWALQ